MPAALLLLAIVLAFFGSNDGIMMLPATVRYFVGSYYNAYEITSAVLQLLMAMVAVGLIVSRDKPAPSSQSDSDRRVE